MNLANGQLFISFHENWGLKLLVGKGSSLPSAQYPLSGVVSIDEIRRSTQHAAETISGLFGLDADETLMAVETFCRQRFSFKR